MGPVGVPVCGEKRSPGVVDAFLDGENARDWEDRQRRHGHCWGETLVAVAAYERYFDGRHERPSFQD